MMTERISANEFSDSLTDFYAIEEWSSLLKSIDEIDTCDTVSLLELDKFYHCSANFHKALINESNYDSFKKVKSAEWQEVKRKIRQIKELSFFLHIKYDLNLQGQMLRHKKTDLKLAESINILTKIIILLTFMLIEIEVLDKGFSFLNIDKYGISLILLVTMVLVYVGFFVGEDDEEHDQSIEINSKP